MGVIVIIYAILGYWAVGQTIYANKIRIGTLSTLFWQQLFLALLLGWILIPIALVKKFKSTRS